VPRSGRPRLRLWAKRWWWNLGMSKMSTKQENVRRAGYKKNETFELETMTLWYIHPEIGYRKCQTDKFIMTRQDWALSGIRCQDGHWVPRMTQFCGIPANVAFNQYQILQ
jgi:hypothetical protein